MATAFEDLSDEEAAAAQALVDDGGCSESRARELVAAVGCVGREEALEVVAGTAIVSGSMVDTRVERLRKLIVALGENAALPNAYELSAIFRVTVSQARSLLRTYEVRHSTDVRTRMDALVTNATVTEVEVGKTPSVTVWRIDFDDPAVMDYASEKLRRRGLSKSLERDAAKLQLSVEAARKDRHGKTALEILGLTTP